MASPDLPGFDEMVDLLRVRIRDADAINSSELHDFKKLMADYADELSDQWYHQAFEELDAFGHLARGSSKLMGGVACGRLSAEGRWYLRACNDD